MEMIDGSSIISLAAAIAVALVFHFLHVPSILLHALHTYIHPDSLPPDKPRALLRPPGDAAPPKRRAADAPSEAQQLYRLRLTHSHLNSRIYFHRYHFLCLLCASALAHLFVSRHRSVAVTCAVCVGTALFALLAIVQVVFDRSFSRSSERLLSAMGAAVGGAVGLLSGVGVIGVVTGAVVVPAFRFSRVFWLGTDQPRSELEVLSVSLPSRTILYLAVMVPVVAGVLPIETIMPLAVKENVKITGLALSAAMQMLAVRVGVQMYLNDAVCSWYQRLHSSRVPDMEYGRAKVFLHNHHICTVALMLFAVPAAVILLLSASQLEGNLLEGIRVEEGLSDGVKGAAFTMAWWIELSWSVCVVILLACYRSRLLIVS